MERIGVRELRQNASGWLRRVQAGESFEVTDRGRTVALLVPPQPRGTLARLIAEGRVTPAKSSLPTYEPLPPQPGTPSLSELLQQMREDER